MTSGQRSGFDPPKLTPEQVAFLAGFADNANNGRRVLCFLAHMCAWFGAGCAVFGSIVGGVLAGITLWQRVHGGPH
jgi:hypothetical protein